MMWVYLILIAVTTICLALRASRNLEMQGRGWFMRNWIGWSIGAFVGAMQALMFSADGWLWTGIGIALAAGAAALLAAPVAKPAP